MEPILVNKLKSKSDVPSCGWVFDEPRTEHVLRAFDFHGLVNVVMDHRRTNGLPVGTIEDTIIEIEEQLCSKIDPKRCRLKTITPTAAKPTGRDVSWADVRNFLRVAANWIRKGLKPVEQAEAERRAFLCADCPFNVESSGCAGCKAREMAADLSLATKGLATSLDSKLKACAVCGCENRAQVHYPLDVLAEGVTADMQFPKWCWKRKTAAPAS